MRTRIKICGITTPEDAALAAQLGVDAIGLIFADSPRQVTAEQARAIVRNIPPFVTAIGVFVNETVRTVEKLHREVGFHVVQLHGSEDRTFLSLLALPAIKCFAVRDLSVLEQIEEYRLPAFLLDTYLPDKPGGTGATFDWTIAVRAKAFGKVILSGGLTPDNLPEALIRVRPWAVDVSSSVEQSPGIKDSKKMKAFIEKVHQWDCQTG